MEVHKEMSNNLDCTGGNPLDMTTKHGQGSEAFSLRKVRLAYEHITFVLEYYFAANHFYFTAIFFVLNCTACIQCCGWHRYIEL
jgi:hypothetical protein